jgi:hypothetical protein
MNRLSRIFAAKTKKATILSIVLIIAVSYGLFFYLQNNTEKDIRNSLFHQQEQRQIESTEALSRRIGSDLDSIKSKLELLVTTSIVAKHLPKFVGVNFSFREWVRETKDTQMPVSYNGFRGIDGIYRIAITFPIINENSREYLGLVAASLPTIPFLSIMEISMILYHSI